MSPRLLITRKRKRRNRSSLLLLCVSLCFFCVFDHAAQEVIDNKATGEDVLNIAETTDPSQTAGESQDNYVYDPTGKTDPFKSFIALQEEMEEKKRRKPRTYLETVELSQLQLTMIVMSGKESWAMVRDSKGLGHVIKKGTFIGTDGGVVHEITNKEVVIREEYKDFRGNVKHKDKSMRLPTLM